MTYYDISDVNKHLETDNDHRFTLMLIILSWLWTFLYFNNYELQQTNYYSKVILSLYNTK